MQINFSLHQTDDMPQSHVGRTVLIWPILLICFNFNPCMDK